MVPAPFLLGECQMMQFLLWYVARGDISASAARQLLKQGYTPAQIIRSFTIAPLS